MFPGYLGHSFMQGGLITYGLLAALAIALLVAAVTDLRRRQIDNWLNAAIALAAPLFWLAMGLTLGAIGWMGGGDVKLLTALALWIQPYWFAQLIFVMAIAGGVLTLIFGAWHIA